MADVTKTTPLPSYVTDQSAINYINSMYDADIASQKATLEAQYNQNVSNMEANRGKIATEYQTQKNAAATDYERQRRNFNQQAMMNGLNTGAGSQAALAQNTAYQNSQAALGAAEGAAYAEIDRSLADLKVQYEADVNDAIAKNDYNRAVALFDEFSKQQSLAIDKAQRLAEYGDFSGYASLYGKDVAKQMETTWLYQNPLIAYTMGKISAAQYKKLTGSDPPGTVSTGRSGGGGGGGYYYRRSKTPTKKSTTPSATKPNGDKTPKSTPDEKPITPADLKPSGTGGKNGNGGVGESPASKKPGGLLGTKPEHTEETKGTNKTTNKVVNKLTNAWESYLNNQTEYNKSQVTMPNKNKVMSRGVGGHSAAGKAKSSNKSTAKIASTQKSKLSKAKDNLKKALKNQTTKKK